MTTFDFVVILTILCMPLPWAVCSIRAKQTGDLGKAEASKAWVQSSGHTMALTFSAFVCVIAVRFVLVPWFGVSEWLGMAFSGVIAAGSIGMAAYAMVASRHQVVASRDEFR